MPVCTVQLLSLHGELSDFVKQVKAISEQPLVLARVVRWMITPTELSVDPLLKQKWDVLVIYKGTTGLPEQLRSSVKYLFTIQAGVPSSIVNNFKGTNAKLLDPQNTVPLTGALDNPRIASSGQGLEFTKDTGAWINQWDPDNTKGAVSMLNLLAFKPNMHEEYMKYGKAFAETIGRRRGGVAKVVGKVTGGDKGLTPGEGGWDEIALAHYPSIRHFADMAASEDYQAVNHKNRLPALRDTCILCTSEVDLPGTSGQKAKL